MAKEVDKLEDEATPAPLPAALKRSIDKVRPEFERFVNGFTELAEERAEVAPKFMRAYEAYALALEKAGEDATFVNFCRLVDPSIPVERSGKKGYKAHRSYQAADYLRRLHATQQAEAEGRRGPAPARPMDAVARIVASILPIIPEGEREKLFRAMRDELHWSEAQVARIMKSVLESAVPLFVATAPKGATIPDYRVRIKHQEEEVEAAA